MMTPEQRRKRRKEKKLDPEWLAREQEYRRRYYLEKKQDPAFMERNRQKSRDYYHSDPAHREAGKQRAKKCSRARYQNDPAYRERRLQADRDRYARKKALEAETKPAKVKKEKPAPVPRAKREKPEAVTVETKPHTPLCKAAPVEDRDHDRDRVTRLSAWYDKGRELTELQNFTPSWVSDPSSLPKRPPPRRVADE